MADGRMMESWNHTSCLIAATLQPHLKKGTSVTPGSFHPYIMKTRKPDIVLTKFAPLKPLLEKAGVIKSQVSK